MCNSLEPLHLSYREPPVRLVELTKEQIPLYNGAKVSLHQITFQEVLGLAEMRQHLPQHLHLTGVQPMSLAIGTELSPLAQDLLPEVIVRAETVLLQWLGDETEVPDTYKRR